MPKFFGFFEVTSLGHVKFNNSTVYLSLQVQLLVQMKIYGILHIGYDFGFQRRPRDPEVSNVSMNFFNLFIFNLKSENCFFIPIFI